MNSATQLRPLEAVPIPSPLPALHTPASPCVTIRAGEGWRALGFHELWDYRELLFFLTWRDIKVRYKQTVLGVAWAIIQPFFGMVVFTIFFGRLAKVPSDGIPYPLFCYAALLPWQLFAYALTESSNSVVANERLITKVYFPRLVIPISAVLAGLLDFVIAFGVLLVMMAYYGARPGWAMLALPLFVLFAVATALGVGLWLSALNVRYRDVRYTLPFITLPYQPLDELSASLSAADLHLVVMGDQMVGVVHPCKIYNILRVGAPFLYIGPRHSHVTDIRTELSDSTAACAAAHGDTDAVIAGILEAKAKPLTTRRPPFGDSFTKDFLVQKFITIIEASASSSVRAISS